VSITPGEAIVFPTPPDLIPVAIFNFPSKLPSFSLLAGSSVLGFFRDYLIIG